MNNFDTAFSNFIRMNFPKAEVVADFLENLPPSLNSDFFFENRTIIGELKCLEVESHQKLNDYIQECMNSGKAPIFYGAMPINKILERCEGKDEILSKAMEKITSSLEERFRKANQQIRETKKSFNLPKSKGLVIVVNIGNTALMLDMAVYFLQKLLKKINNGVLAYPEIDYVIFTSDRHYTIIEGRKALPMVSIVKEFDTEESRRFFDEFRRRWAIFKRSYLFEGIENGTQDNLKRFNRLM